MGALQHRKYNAMQSNVAQDVANSFLYADGLLEFLVKEKSFNEERVRSAVQRVINAKGKSTQGEVCDLWCPRWSQHPSQFTQSANDHMSCRAA